MVTITIQAPAGGATLQVVAQHRALDVSIHAPAGGATRTLKPRKTIGTCVSIHAPAGGATVPRIGMLAYCTVSIHAPAGGATMTRPLRRLMPRSFNPRARGGRDLHRGCNSLLGVLFQSTRPRGARPCLQPGIC